MPSPTTEAETLARRLDEAFAAVGRTETVTPEIDELCDALVHGGELSARGFLADFRSHLRWIEADSDDQYWGEETYVSVGREWRTDWLEGFISDRQDAYVAGWLKSMKPLAERLFAALPVLTEAA